MHRYYFDNNATTPLAEEVVEAMLPYLRDHFGNPSSNHRFGEKARAAIDTARQQVADLVNCRSRQITFTSGGSEANNMAIMSAVASDQTKRHIITSVVEHPSVLAPIAYLEKSGYTVTRMPVSKEGDIDLARLEKAIRPETILVSLMAANNETGVLWPIGKIAEICRKHQILFHCDAIQMAGKLRLNMASLPIDYLSMAAHKLHGPKGTGALCVQRSTPLSPLIHGSAQENGMRAGTENVAGIVGFGKAAELAASHVSTSDGTTSTLRDAMEKCIVSTIKEVQINGGSMPRLPNTSNISFKGTSSAALIQELDEHGFAISAHSACQSGDLDPSHVLQAMDIPEEFMHGTLRISFSRYTLEENVKLFTRTLTAIVAKSRTVAAF